MGIGSSSAGTAPPPATPQPQNGGASPPYAPQYPNEPSAHEHQKTVAIKNYANIKKDSLRVEPDEENPGKFVVAFTFNAAAPGSVTIMYFTKEDADFNLVATEQDRLLSPVEVPFHKGFDQEFRQACGTGIDFAVFEEIGLTKEEDAEQVYPLVVKAEAHVANGVNSQITHAVFEKKENGEYKVRVMKQILWVDNQRYELLEIYGIEAAGKECIICLSEPRDTVVLPCRHMCMCSGCAKLLRLQKNRCSVCRQPIERLMDINVNNAADGALG